MKTAMKQATLALVLGLAALGAAGTAQAAGTLAGTSITNTATLAYSVGTISQTAISADSIPFKVDRKINLTVTRTDATIVIVNPGQLTATIGYTVTNQGNDTQDFNLIAMPEPSPATLNPFDGVTPSSFTGTPATINVAGSGTKIFGLAPDGVKIVTITFAIPIGQVDKDIAVYCLKAIAKVADGTAATPVDQTIADSSGIWTVFADAAGSDDIVRDASYSARGAVIVTASVLTIGKTALTIWDPANFSATPRSIPGAYVQYAITISNAGTATSSASLTTISDTLNAVTPLDPDLMNKTLGTAIPTPDSAAGKGFRVTHTATRPSTPSPTYYTTTADADGVDIAGLAITVDFAKVLPALDGYGAGQLKPGESVTITFNVKIN